MLKFQQRCTHRPEDLRSQNCNGINKEEVTCVSPFFASSRFFSSPNKQWTKRVKQDENLAKEDQTHDRFLSARIIPDHQSNVSSVSLLSTHAMCRARLIVSRVSSRRGLARTRSTILYGVDSVIYLFVPWKHKQKCQTRRYARGPPGKRQRAYPRDLDSRSWLPTFDRNRFKFPNPKADLRTISARDTLVSRFVAFVPAIMARLFAVEHKPQTTTRNFQSKRSHKIRSRHCGWTYWGINISYLILRDTKFVWYCSVLANFNSY